MKTIIDIKPCPFCNGYAQFSGYNGIAIHCYSCDIELTNPDGNQFNKSEMGALIVKWNQRPDNKEEE